RLPEIQLWKSPFLKSGNLLRSVVWANLYLAGFNLLPAYPMDGGRVLRALFSGRMDPVHATRRAVSIGQAFATIFILGGIFLPNYWLTLVGIFLFLAAQMEECSVVFRSVLESVRLEAVMLTDFATLSPADTLEDALEKGVHPRQDDFPVIPGTDIAHHEKRAVVGRRAPKTRYRVRAAKLLHPSNHFEFLACDLYAAHLCS